MLAYLLNWLDIGVSLIVIFVLGLTLIRVFRGSRFSLVIWLLIMLIISSFGLIGSNVFGFGTFVDPDHDTSLAIDIGLPACYFVHESTFAVAHWILAAKYRANAYETPLKL